MDTSRDDVLHDLLSHREWLANLARRLVAEPAQADDLVQETWLEAVRKPPRHAAAPRAWLATVARRLSRRRSCGLPPAVDPESVSMATGRAEAPPDALLRATLQRELVDAVLRLDEPYRSTVLARYFDDLTPGQIARRQGIPANTVKARLRRGLATLRSRLDRERGGDGSWRVVLLAMTWTRPRRHAPMSKVAWMIGLVTFVTGWSLLANLEKSVEPPSSSDFQPIALDDLHEVVAQDVLGTLRRNTMEGPRIREPPRPTQLLRVTLEGSDQSVPDALVRALTGEDLRQALLAEARRSPHVGEPRMDERADSFGTPLEARRDGLYSLPEDSLYVVAETETHWWGSTVFRPGDVLRLELRPKRPFALYVVDPHGRAVADVPVRIRVRRADRLPPSLLQAAVTDASGVFRSSRLSILAATMAKEPVLEIELPIPARQTPRLTVEPGASVVRSTLPAGAPWNILPYEGMPVVANSVVALEALGVDDDEDPAAWFVNATQRAFGEQGVTFPHVPLETRWRARISTARGNEWHVLDGPQSTGRRLVTTLSRPRSPIVDVAFADEAGLPLAECRVGVVQRVDRNAGSWHGSLVLDTDGEGRLRMPVPPEAAASESMHLGFVVTRRTDPDAIYELGPVVVAIPAAGIIELGARRLERTPPVLAGVLLDADDRPLPGITLFVERRSGPFLTSRRSLVTDDLGRFAFVAPHRTLGTAAVTPYRVSAPGGLRVVPVDVETGDLSIVMRLQR